MVGVFGREFARIGLLFCVCIGLGCRGSLGMRRGMKVHLEEELARVEAGYLLLHRELCGGKLLMHAKSRIGSDNGDRDSELM